jgi:hypothetical protein
MGGLHSAEGRSEAAGGTGATAYREKIDVSFVKFSKSRTLANAAPFA